MIRQRPLGGRWFLPRKEVQEAPRVRQTRSVACLPAGLRAGQGIPVVDGMCHASYTFMSGRAGLPARLVFQEDSPADPALSVRGVNAAGGELERLGLTGARHPRGRARRSLTKELPQWRTKRSESGSRRTIIV